MRLALLGVPEASALCSATGLKIAPCVPSQRRGPIEPAYRLTAHPSQHFAVHDIKGRTGLIPGLCHHIASLPRARFKAGLVLGELTKIVGIWALRALEEARL